MSDGLAVIGPNFSAVFSCRLLVVEGRHDFETVDKFSETDVFELNNFAHLSKVAGSVRARITYKARNCDVQFG